jgi:hypothetical protein
LIKNARGHAPGVLRWRESAVGGVVAAEKPCFDLVLLLQCPARIRPVRCVDPAC